MIFAAGLGSRLKNETQEKPKALVEINGKTMLQHCIETIKKIGINQIVINVHHFSAQITKYLTENKNFECEIKISDETNELLDTGGAILHAKSYFINEKFVLLHNVDIISSINIKEMIDFHISSGALATVAAQNRANERKLLFDEQNRLSGWRNLKSGAEIITRPNNFYNELSFSGLHVINTKIFDVMQNTGKFSIFKEFLDLSNQYLINAFVHNNDFWLDAGKPETLEIARNKVFM